MTDSKNVDYIRDDLNSLSADQLSKGLLSPEGADLIQRVINAPVASDEDGITIGRFVMPLHGGATLIRLFVIRGPEGQYILYVPEQPAAPTDRIFHENHDWTRTGYVLGEFLGKPGGLEYMLDLVPEDQRGQVADYFEEISRLPSAWNKDALVLQPVAGETYLHQIQAIVNR
ncbi:MULTISPECIES: dermonecrotic toxin domain-containing protein [Pseudomonas syringae group]|uniref:dermonecrotic toxin domain-containing protein n=1 Tax=Pseudomonas syringae group TaxID=136849 RepID=UPI000F022DC1|nr:DUF6543 domain-containing protein [Pseudomonas viridiflava]MCF8977673.1 hypothetical protein [Pseudomonas syringae]MCI3913006.1 hypothetical protein [Pseudomonas viridiflava]QXG24187.1 hypothetical protein KTT56_20715 [Pseudomonas viridiflava]